MIDDSPKWLPLQKKLSHMSIPERVSWVQNLSSEDQKLVIEYPEVFLADYQLLPEGDWSNYWMRWGRGLGKTYAMLITAHQKIRQGAQEICYIAPTFIDLKKEVYPTLFKILPDKPEKADLQAGIIEYHGALLKFYTSEVEPRGMNADYMFFDEVAKWCGNNDQQISYIIALAKLGLRGKKADRPQLIIGSTPKPYQFFKDFEQKIADGNPAYLQRIVSTRDAVFLTPTAKRQILAEFKDHPLERQEIDADILTDTDGAYWTHDLIAKCRAKLPAPLIRLAKVPLTNAQLMGKEPLPLQPDLTKPYCIRIVIGFDPAVSTHADECGIVVAALYSDGNVYILADESGHYSPAQYSKLIADLYKQYNASAIVVEVNQGGNAIEYALRAHNAKMHIIPIHTHEGKLTRAEHTATLYYKNKVFHIDTFKKLEDQMCSFNINYSKSPDRVDALNLCCSELFFPTKPTQRFAPKALLNL